MSFYHTNSNVSIGNILDLCDIANLNLNLDRDKTLRSFLRADIATIDDLSFYTNNKYSLITDAKYIIGNKELIKKNTEDKSIIISNMPDCDVAKISNLFYRPKSINELAKLDNFKAGSNSTISNSSIIGNEVIIGDNFLIGDYSSISHNCIIGDNVKVGKNVSISNSIIGDNVFIGDGTRIGQDGFGFAYDSKFNPIKIFHIGRVIIQNDVNINANCTIDKGSFNDTVIGEKTFIDNLVHIAHNVVIGNNCIIAGQCGFAGSSKIGNFVQIGGQTGIGGHIKIADYVKIAAKSGIIRDVKKSEVVMGYPAINITKYLKNYKKLMM
jgi:UDP-3-O-[3-hydroxymyristoyl] glucosamine N-acyltransferase